MAEKWERKEALFVVKNLEPVLDLTRFVWKNPQTGGARLLRYDNSSERPLASPRKFDIVRAFRTTTSVLLFVYPSQY